MSKIKLDDRIKDGVDAFFDAGPDSSYCSMTYTGCDTAAIADARPFSERAGNTIGVAREILLFGPGTFFLYLATIAAIEFYPFAGISIRGLFWVAAFAFMAYAGSGSIRKINNLAVPATVIVLAALVSSLLTVFHIDLFSLSTIYAFPFVLIAAKVIQGWIRTTK